MKLFISADIEGATGITSGPVQASSKGSQYGEGRKWMTGDVNAAIEGALEAGVEEVLVKDAHGSALNLLPDELHARAMLIQGWGPADGMMEGLDESFDLCFLVGYHAMAGTLDGILAHTWTGAVRGVWVNGTEIGEMGLSALFAGHHSVPVALVTSCAVGAAQAEALLPWVRTVSVKRGITRSCAELLPPSEAREKIRAGAQAAAAGVAAMQPFKPDMPCSVKMAFRSADVPLAAELVPGVERVPPESVQFEAPDALSALHLTRLLLHLTR
ncbi:MAG: M55 family metallopeptidase [Armatimonadota bacterium]|jgi:D-amino peptidase